MKRILPFCLCLCCVGLTSCFRTNLYVGNARPDDRKVKVSQESFNHHFVGGLIPGGNTTMTASEYVDDADSFVVQTSTGFLNGLVGGVTAGIYTPTQTKFYLPVEELEAPVSILVSVSKRRFKRAVKRNRVKRQIREAYRKNKHGLLQTLQDEGRQLAVAFIYLSDRLVDSLEIEERMKVALARITEKVLADVAVQKAGENATSAEKTGSAGQS